MSLCNSCYDWGAISSVHKCHHQSVRVKINSDVIRIDKEEYYMKDELRETLKDAILQIISANKILNVTEARCQVCCKLIFTTEESFMSQTFFIEELRIEDFFTKSTPTLICIINYLRPNFDWFGIQEKLAADEYLFQDVLSQYAAHCQKPFYDVLRPIRLFTKDVLCMKCKSHFTTGFRDVSRVREYFFDVVSERYRGSVRFEDISDKLGVVRGIRRIEPTPVRGKSYPYKETFILCYHKRR